MLQDWPKKDEKLIDQKTEKEMELLKEIITKVRNIKAEMGVQTKDIELLFSASKKSEKETVRGGEAFIKFLTKATKIAVEGAIKEKPRFSATGVVSDIQFFIPLKGLIDIEKEVGRLKKEEQNINQELDRLKKLLANKNFTSKAAPEAVEKQKVRQKELSEKLKIISERVADLS